MNTTSSMPPFRDLPPGRLADRQQHLLTEIRRDQARQADWPRLPSGILGAQLGRRRLVVVLTLAAVLGALAATPAFGVRDALLELLGADRFPRPADVEGEPATTGPHIVLAAGQLGDQKWKLVANESDKGLCLHLELIEPQRARSGGCGFALKERGIGLLTSNLASGSTWIFGPVSRRASTVEIRLADGTEIAARIFPGRGFAPNFYLATRATPITPTSVTARGATGSVVGRQDID